jgi:hypothetical protein
MKPAASGQLTPMKLERAPSYSAKFFGNGILKGGENNTPQNGRAVKKLHSSRSLGRSSEDMATLERVAEWAEADSFTGPGEKELHARVLAWQEIMRRQQVLASPPGWLYGALWLMNNGWMTIAEIECNKEYWKEDSKGDPQGD